MRKLISVYVIILALAAAVFGLYCAHKGKHETFQSSLICCVGCISAYTALNINRKE
ncbi:MAG: hypothetical protein IJM44_03585 [Ruminococcus sp.]|nr:hypothetical protein [Ruminococcus sp.]